MQILLADCPLKHLLRLFAAADPIQVYELGDTWHPSSGYVDETLIAGVTTVGQLQAYPYDFDGLVCFVGEVADVAVRFRSETYEISGPDKIIWRLRRRLVELNAEPGFQPKLQQLAQRED